MITVAVHRSIRDFPQLFVVEFMTTFQPDLPLVPSHNLIILARTHPGTTPLLSTHRSGSFQPEGTDENDRLGPLFEQRAKVCASSFNDIFSLFFPEVDFHTSALHVHQPLLPYFTH